MKCIKQQLLISIALAGLLVACDGGSSDDPATVSRDGLNPPADLQTLTGSGSIEVWWRAQNAEEDFQGFYVFGTTKTIEELEETSIKPNYPTTGVDMTLAGFPRCALNSKFFEQFGLPATDRKCEGDEASDEAADSSFHFGLTTQSDSDSDTTEVEETLSNFLTCDGTATTPSKKLTTASLGWEKCTVTKAYDPDTGALVDLQNGTEYTFIVVAVSGDEFQDISWSSNIVSDAPSVDIAVSDLVLPADQYASITIDPATASATVSSAAACPGATGGNTYDPVCDIRQSNNIASSEYKIFLGRNSTTSNKQRVFISTSSDASSKMQLQPRGEQSSGGSSRILGDTPTPAAAYTPPGTKFAVYGNQVFDFVLTYNGNKHYGKIFVSSRALTTATDATSNVTLSSSIVFQTGPGLAYYFQ